MIVVCASESPRSAIISTRSRKLSLYRRYQRTQSTMISRSKWRPLKRSSTFNMLGQVHRGLIYRRICATPTLRTRTRHLDVFTPAPVGLCCMREKGHAAWGDQLFSPFSRAAPVHGRRPILVGDDVVPHAGNGDVQGTITIAANPKALPAKGGAVHRHLAGDPLR